jgi:hypothetical protein
MHCTPWGTGKQEKYTMGTLSKRGLREFGIDVEQRIQAFRTSVGSKLDELGANADLGRMEDTWARRLDRISSALSPVAWFALAGGALLGGIGLGIARRRGLATLVAAFAPTLMILGIHNHARAVGSDRADLH